MFGSEKSKADDLADKLCLVLSGRGAFISGEEFGKWMLLMARASTASGFLAGLMPFLCVGTEYEFRAMVFAAVWFVFWTLFGTRLSLWTMRRYLLDVGTQIKGLAPMLEAGHAPPEEAVKRVAQEWVKRLDETEESDDA